MIRPRDTLTNPVTGEVLIFHRTSAQTNGESVLVETVVRPDGFVSAAHGFGAHSEGRPLPISRWSGLDFALARCTIQPWLGREWPPL